LSVCRGEAGKKKIGSGKPQKILARNPRLFERVSIDFAVESGALSKKLGFFVAESMG
jgi:hypothetical protein